MQKYQGKIEQTVVHPFIINAFVIPDNICLTRGWYCNLIKGEKKSLKWYLLLNCKYSYHTVQSDQSKLLFTMYLFFIDIVGEIGKKYTAINSVSKFSLACIHSNISKGYFCHKPIC